MSSVLTSWIDLNRRYVESWGGGDAAFGYTENTNTAMLAAAAWANDFPAICEVNASKGHPNSRHKWYGRIDIYIDARTDWYFGEAKKSEVNCSVSTDGWHEKFQKGMGEALADARQVAAAGEGNRYIALSFSALVCNDSMSIESDANEITKNCISYLESKPFDASAWYFFDEPMKWTETKWGLGVNLAVEAVR